MTGKEKTLIFGGTGHLGRDLVRALAPTDTYLRIASRQVRPPTIPGPEWFQADLASGRGVQESLRDVQRIIFCAGSAIDHAAVEIHGMRRLLSFACKAKVSHFIYVSIVGIDHLPVPYYRTKLEAERLIKESGIPYTIVRATQFHYFIDLLLSKLARVPFLIPIPKEFSVQPVATEDVAVRLAGCLSSGPQNATIDFCGPDILSFARAARLWKNARGLRKPLLQIPIPGKLGHAFREGHNTDSMAERGSTRWSEWLETQFRKPVQHGVHKNQTEVALV